MEFSTIFSGFNKPVGNESLIFIIKDIREGKYRADIESIRSSIASGNTEKADQLKKQLPAFTPSATFIGGRKSELLDQYSGFVHLDFDKLTPEQLNNTFLAISKIPYTFACFRSPSGNGLKVFVEVTTGEQEHETAYKQVQNYYEKALGILCDPKCKDITRLCFFSFDPDTYKNNKNRKFEVQIKQELKEKQEPIKIPDYSAFFDDCISFTQQKEQYIDGNRNNFIYLLASNCNRKGIPESIALDFITTNFDLSDLEIRASVKSAYNHHPNELANFAKSAKVQTNSKVQSLSNETIEEDYLKNTPIIPDELYNRLPELLKSGALAFSDERERDVFLTGGLSILSGCLPNVKGIYSQEVVYPNLFSFIIAPAASGKGVLKSSKSLADKYHEQILKTSREELQRYDVEMNEYKSRQRFKKKQEVPEDPPIQPPFKVVFIPANSSYAKILSHLEQNQGDGIICETEADTMGNVLKHEWGGYSDMLRKAFHHEHISSSKKANNEYIEVKEPRLSVALSGTPNQVTGLIASAEDGLFSRFLFYAFKVEQQWRDVSPYVNNINRTDYIRVLSEQVYELVLFLGLSPTTIELSQDQWQKLNGICSKWLNEVTTFAGADAGSIVKRLGLVLYRICMIFTALRKWENKDSACNQTCTEIDFGTAVQLVELYQQHSLLMFHNLPKQNENSVFRSGDNKRKFFDALPNDFKRAEAIEIGKTFNLSTRSIDSLLKELAGKFLTQPQYGSYTKI
ncbi:MAG: DUF3987 domain-containing protein [Bacteroidota bacterium]